MAAFALTIFTGAFLLFQVQPLIGKYILPWFGGGPGVWTTCMLFFQVLLLGGYAYAHLVSRCLKPRTQAIVHLVLLAAALALLPITPRDSWKPHGSGNPTWQILLLLAGNLGLPYLVLSTTGPLIQHWFSRARPGTSPYRLYALSNFGSLLALLSYPFFFETHFTRKTQAAMWGWGLVAYVICCGFCAIRLIKSEGRNPKAEGSPNAEVPTSPGEEVRPSDFGPRTSHPLAPLLWLLLPCCASVLLLAVTNKLCQDVAVIPFLWILPLALYLLSFIICFDNPRWYRRFPYTFALIAALAGLCWALFNSSDLALPKQVAFYCGGLFICCMVCHGELYRLRPDARSLTAFYLMIAAGGALGGVFVAVVAPHLFTDYYELNWGIWLCGALFFLVCATDRSPGTPWQWLAWLLMVIFFAGLDWTLSHPSAYPRIATRTFLTGVRIAMWTVLGLLLVSWGARKKFRDFRHGRFVACTWLFLGVVGLAAVLSNEARSSNRERVFRCRSFYGVLTVYEYEKEDPESHYFLLQHGRITHGLQFTDAARADIPASYYGPDSGIGIGVSALRLGPRRIGVVGLGTGSMAAFARPGDCVRFYEINPQVEAVAKSWFSYLPKCSGSVEVAPGDARLTLEQEPPQRLDMLVLDAFSSDAIPVHLLTEEAFRVYERHLSTNAIIAVHISNHYLDLEPVVANLARRFGYTCATIDYEENDEDWWFYSSTWMLLSRNARIIDSAPIRYAANTNSVSTNLPLWTDDFTSIFQILR
jgi:hypothetical protein